MIDDTEPKGGNNSGTSPDGGNTLNRLNNPGGSNKQAPVGTGNQGTGGGQAWTRPTQHYEEPKYANLGGNYGKRGVFEGKTDPEVEPDRISLPKPKTNPEASFDSTSWWEGVDYLGHPVNIPRKRSK